jgi:LPXTG-motif cell wall-anchored protein
MRLLKSFTCLAIVAAFLAFAVPAGAHMAEVTGVASCSDGAHLVTWTITNNHLHKATTVTASASAEGVAYDVSVVTNPIPADSSTEATTVVPGGVTGTVTITVVATWSDEFTRTVTATVGLPHRCSTTETTAPPTTVPPTTVPPTTAPTPTSVGISPSTIVPTTAPSGVAGVESGPATLANTGSSDSGAAVVVGLGLMVAGAGLVALKRRPAR